MQFTKDNIPKCIECFKSYEYSSSFEISSFDFETLMISLKRISPSYCNVCERTHEHEDAYLHLKESEDTDHADLFFNCRKGESKRLGTIEYLKLPDYDNMTEEEINKCKMKFRNMFEDLCLRFPTWSIQMPDFETESLFQIHTRYRDITMTIGEYQNQLELKKRRSFFSNIDSIFPSGETTFDYTTGIFRELIISQILLLNDISDLSFDKLMDSLKKKISCDNEEDKLEIQRLTISTFLWLMVYLIITSPDNPLNESLLSKGLVIVESEDITTTTTTTKTINSEIFNGENLSTTYESTKVLKVITKIIVKDRDYIWNIITTSNFSEDLVSSEN